MFPLTQSQPTESTHGTHRTTSAPRSPNPDKEAAESSAPRRSTMIHLCIPERDPTLTTPPLSANNEKGKGKLVEETNNSPIPIPIRSPRIHTNLVSSDTEKLQELTGFYLHYYIIINSKSSLKRTTSIIVQDKTYSLQTLQHKLSVTCNVAKGCSGEAKGEEETEEIDMLKLIQQDRGNLQA
ncbi:hypothetical protein Tco_1252587 [Tanacetum coccineum]